MADLTLEQVKQAGLLSWRNTDSLVFSQYQFVDGRFLRLDADGYAKPFDGELPSDGWRHVPGCDCKFCS